MTKEERDTKKALVRSKFLELAPAGVAAQVSLHVDIRGNGLTVLRLRRIMKEATMAGTGDEYP